MSNANDSNGLISSPWQEWTARLQAYVAWLNSQLKKHEGCRKISDLRNDLQDGVVISQLIEALGGAKVVGINPNPTSPASRKENVERVFQYFLFKKVPIANCKAKDVLAGDLKSIMRLIHAVASHYRPDTVLNPPTSNVILTTQQHRHRRCASSLDNNAFTNMTTQNTKPVTCTSLGRTKFSGQTKKVLGGSALPIRRQPLSSREYPKSSATFSSLSLDKDKASVFRKSLTALNADKTTGKAGETGVAFRASNPKISCKVAPLQYPKGLAPTLHTSGTLPNTKLCVKKKQLTSRSEPCSLDSVEANTVIESVDINEVKTCSCSLTQDITVQLLKDVKETKALLFLLQDVLLHGNNGKLMNDSEHCAPYGSPDDADNIPARQILRDPVAVDNKGIDHSARPSEPLSMVKKLISYMSVCGERKRMNVEDNTNSQNCNPPDIAKKSERENEILRKLVAEKEQEIQNLKLTISNFGSCYDKKLKYSYVAHTRTQREELQVVHEAITSLRKCFPVNDPYQHTLDTIEQSLSALLERVNSLEIGAIPQQQPTTVTEFLPGAARRSTFEHSLDSRNNSTSHSMTFSQRIEAGQNSTKVVYYMDKSVTPFRCVLNKKIGEATLRDFKLLFDRPGQYRYHFKTLDPEFGMVKEEVLHDEDILPGWDGKVIAWIEEDCS